MRILVTGATGFIGSHLLELLPTSLGLGLVKGTDRRAGEASHSRSNVLFGDLLDADFRARALRGIDVVLHHAGQTNVQQSLEFPLACFDDNLRLTALLLEDARKAGVRRFVFPSSAAVYGNHGNGVQEERQLPLPESPYAACKLAAEALVAGYARHSEMDTVILRYFNVFGPRQRADSAYCGVIARFCLSFMEDGPLTVYGTGAQTRDFIHVKDIVQANIRAVEHPSRLNGAVVNIASGAGRSIHQLVAELNGITGLKRIPMYEPSKPGEVLHSKADIAKAGELLGFSPRIDFRAGLDETLAWY
ncbi:MAG: NAD-dependent epimerase/dehydratase family protein, partial [Planctomycetes bacterium]|nr:NAD-dependent epimerase/dehydratase family protein [Planctomycetota bacterium]